MSGHGSGTARLMREAVRTPGKVFMREVLGSGVAGQVHETEGRCLRRWTNRQCENEGFLGDGLCVACWTEMSESELGRKLTIGRRLYCARCQAAEAGTRRRVSTVGIRAEAG